MLLAEQNEILKSLLAEHGVPRGTPAYASGERYQVIEVASAAVAGAIQMLIHADSGEAFWSELATHHPALVRGRSMPAPIAP